MNEPSEQLPDELLEDLLLPLRSIEVPAEAHRANRCAVRDALDSRVHVAWWRRTIAVPVPVAIAASILLLLGALALGRTSTTRHVFEHPAPSVAAQSVDSRVASKANSALDEVTKPTWTIERSFIRTLISSARSEFVASHSLENRDDS